jgi:hypothetical protein
VTLDDQFKTFEELKSLKGISCPPIGVCLATWNLLLWSTSVTTQCSLHCSMEEL